MYTLLVIIILIIVAIAIRTFYTYFKVNINFFITGLDSGFNISDLFMLWKVAALCELEEPNSLFYSMSALSKCMTMVTSQSTAQGGEQSEKTQRLLTKLFDFRTKLQNKSDEKKGVSSSKSIEKGQSLRIIFPGKGVFASKVLNNGSTLAISVPRQKNLIPVPAEEWVGRVISVYFWRKGDARYVFDSTVMQNGMFVGESALFLKHTSNLLRTQKRKSVRVNCTIPGNLFIVKNRNVDYSAIETRNAYRCIILDLSESGALIKIGGKGIQDIKIKLQFQLNNKLILMFGIVRTVQYHADKNQSLLHFECTHIEQNMKNEILSFVYNTIPDSEKEVLEALEQTDLDIEASKEDDKENKLKTELSEELSRTSEASHVKVNNLDIPGMIDKPAGEMPATPVATEDFSEDDIEELEEV